VSEPTEPLLRAYERALAERGFKSDPAQLAAVQALQRCIDDWTAYKAQRSNAITKWVRKPPLPKGVYMHGGVGRGKSFLMDLFFHSVPVTRKTRLHFHEFMREVHRQLNELRGTPDPLDVLAANMAKRFRLFCFDEFHVADITDAMILYRLLEGFAKHRIAMVTTSNFHPDSLYPNGLHRDRLLPAIELLKRDLQVISVDNGTDYRQSTMQGVQTYHHPLSDTATAALTQAFNQLAESRDEDPVLRIEQREIQALRKAGSVVWFDFKTLCGGPRSQNDYLEMASRFHTVILSGVPAMPPRMASEARRFTWLVDVLYDRRVKFIVSAEVAPEQLYLEGPMAHEFPRTVSRLAEMQSAEYLALARRDVDTTLT
jgi:cell division protein ZapE